MTQSIQKDILRSAILAAIQKVYLDTYIRVVREGQAEQTLAL
mgnify:FL=1